MNIIIENIDGVTSEQLLSMKESLASVIDQLSTELEIGMLDRLVVPRDYGKAVTSFQRENNLIEGYTDNEMGYAGGVTMNYINSVDQKVKVIIFIHQTILLGLFNKENVQLSLNTIQHELAHVHDYQQMLKMKKFYAEYKDSSNRILEKTLERKSMMMWQEYLAPRLAARSVPIEFALNAPYLLERIEHTKEEIEKKILKYRFDGNINHLFQEVVELVDFLLKAATTVLGNFHGFTSEKNDIIEALRKVVDKEVNETYFRETWSLLENELLTLFKDYPKWNGIEVFNKLNEITLQLWNEFGIFPKNQGSDLYISVP